MLGTFDLRSAQWIPFRRRSGHVEFGSPANLTDAIATDPVVAVASGRPDFDGAVQEFLIGLLTMALNPADETEWLALWKAPPSVATIATKLGDLPDAFNLDGDGPRFLQDTALDELEAVRLKPPQELIIPMAGANERPIDTHAYVKTHRIDVLGLPAAAMALLTLQTYAPAGGRGHRTSLRGGGPLTTLVEPRIDAEDETHAHDQPLWQKLWANVETSEQWQNRPSKDGETQERDVFPWMGTTRISSKGDGGPTTPKDAHALQCYFGMPRRIRLEFGADGVCDLTGAHSEKTVTGFRMKSYGTEYESWRHPLSPYYESKSEWLPVHPRSGGIAWKDWLGLVVRDADGTSEPALCVSHFLQRRATRLGLIRFRVHAFGYDMSNMKARDWTDSTMPALVTKSGDEGAQIRSLAASLISGTELAIYALRSAIDRAMFARPEDVSGDRSFRSVGLWRDTESTFYESLKSLTDTRFAADSGTIASERFQARLSAAAEALFDQAIRTGEMQASPRRVVAARYDLVEALRGWSKLGKKLFKALGLNPPERARSLARSSGELAREGTDVS